MAKKSGGREKIKLVSPVSGFFYTTYRNKRNMSGKLQLQKYDPVARQRVLFKEAKI